MVFPWFSLCSHMIPSTSALPKPARRNDSTSMLSSPQSRRNRPNLMVSLLRTGIISHLLSGVSHQVYIMYNIYIRYIMYIYISDIQWFRISHPIYTYTIIYLYIYILVYTAPKKEDAEKCETRMVLRWCFQHIFQMCNFSASFWGCWLCSTLVWCDLTINTG